MLDIIGYVGMAFILSSWLFTKLWLIRLINCCGAVCYIIYGLLTKTYPTVLLNAALIVLNAVMAIRAILKERHEKR